MKVGNILATMRMLDTAVGLEGIPRSCIEVPALASLQKCGVVNVAFTGSALSSALFPTYVQRIGVLISEVAVQQWLGHDSGDGVLGGVIPNMETSVEFWKVRLAGACGAYWSGAWTTRAFLLKCSKMLY